MFAGGILQKKTTDLWKTFPDYAKEYKNFTDHAKDLLTFIRLFI